MKAICYSLYRETYVPLKLPWSRRGLIKRSLARPVSVLVSWVEKLGVRIVQPARYTREQVERGQVGVPSQAHSMIGLVRMNNLKECVETVLRENIPGNLIETGVWRGGACIFMRGILKAFGSMDRRVYVADSFSGLPKPDEVHYPADRGDDHYLRHSTLAISLDDVKENFRKYDLLDDQVVFLVGWFKDTLPTLADERFAVIRLDGDMYESTMDAMKNLYPRLSPGGFCIIDDFNLANCREAVHDYRKLHSIQEELIKIDENGVFWRKPFHP